MYTAKERFGQLPFAGIPPSFAIGGVLSKDVAKPAEFSMELPDAEAKPVTEPNVYVTVNNTDGIPPEYSDVARKIAEQIRENVKKRLTFERHDDGSVTAKDGNGITRVRLGNWDEEAWKETSVAQESTELGVYRPNLQDRKVGKVRVELVDNGFPLALREVAKVMTWAQTAKGYKDHDWQNLPNAEVALAAAASRHRTDYIMQRYVDGLDAVDCVDIESEIVHKAHEAFGVLAQLELLLRGEFK